MIHETAIIHPKASIADNVIIGPYSIIGPEVHIGSHCDIGPHVVIKGPTRIGEHNKISQFCSIGEDSQDKKFSGEHAELIIGNNNIIREFCTFNRGSNKESPTVIGNNGLFMAYVHIAHDCNIGDNVIFANNASLAGHIQIDHHAILGGMTGVHQFCRVGAHSFAAGGSMIAQDVLPYTKVSGYYAKPFGLNTEGLRRNNFSQEQIRFIKNLYKIIYRQGRTLKEAISMLKNDFADRAEAKHFLEVMEVSKRGIVR